MQLRAAYDWADHVVVQVNSMQLKDPDRELDEFINRFEQQRIARLEQARRDAQASEEDRSAQNNVCEDVHELPPDSLPDPNYCHEDIDWFNVKLAEIKCPEGDLPSNNPNNASQKRIFYLGLLFYELFSGGQLPPPKLYELASHECAFVSLSVMTLVQSNNEDQATTGSKRHQSTNQGGGICSVYCEYLKLINVTNSLCHLIRNMLDCVYGDLASEDSYSHMAEIESDLQLMLDQPKFLQGLNMETITPSSQSLSTSSQLSEVSISREQEIQSILSCYHRCISGSREIAIVKGVSGAGKSYLARQVGSSIISEGGLFLMGKYDQMQQSTPFSALASALDQYCDLLIGQLGSVWANTVINKLQSALGRDISYLIKIIPKLSTIFNNSARFLIQEPDNNIKNAIQRIQYLLCQFIETIASSSIVSITLCLDDVQWMDKASISVMRYVLTQSHNKFFFLACCRNDEMSDTHPFWGMLESIQCLSVNLKNVDANMLESVLSNLLCLSPRIVKPLASIVYTKTKGLPLFVSEMLRSLHRDGLLRVDLDNKRWVWDQDKICAAKLPDNAALSFTNGITKLPTEVRLALQTLSMFGSSAKTEHIKALETQLNVNLTEPLEIATREGLVSNARGSYQFSHDRIQETCYAMISEKDRVHNHLMYGQCLAKLASETNNDDLMFISVNQLNLAGPGAVTEWNDYIAIAKYNLDAGKKATEMSDFSLAHKLFSSGIKFLPLQHWNHHYAVSLELHELAAKAALAAGNIESMGLFSETILKHAKCFADEWNIHLIVIMSLMHIRNINEALEMGLGILTRLGEDISRDATEDDFVDQVKRTQAMLAGVSEDTLMGYEPMKDKKKRAAMKFLASLHTCSYIAAPSLHRFVVLKLVQLTVTYG
jgi:predicted ATPase